MNPPFRPRIVAYWVTGSMLLACAPLFAADRSGFSDWQRSFRLPEMVVDATNGGEGDAAPTPSPSVSILGERELGLKGAPNPIQALQATPGVEALQQGAPGQTTSVFIRGARSEDTLVLIDGIQANEPMNPARGFDFANLDVENVERIEVFRGPQGARFGPGAMGGVINIITKQGGPRSGRLFGEGGSYGTYRGALSARGQTGRADWSLGASGFKTSGISAASEALGNSERDAADRVAFSGRAGLNLAGGARVEAVARSTKTRTDLDARGGRGGDDPNSLALFRQVLAGATVRDTLLSGRVRSLVRATFAESQRSTSNPSDPANPDSNEDGFIGDTKRIETIHEATLSEGLTGRVAVDYREESGASSSSGVSSGAPTSSAFDRRMEHGTGASAALAYAGDSFFGDVAYRWEKHSRAGAFDSARAEIGYRAQTLGSTLRASVGSGFRAPSLFQLYSRYGDSELKPERAIAYEASFEQAIGESVRATITRFRTRFDQLIDYDFATSRYRNVKDSQVDGWEIQAAWDISPTWSLTNAVTFLDARDGTTGERLLRRADGSWTASLEHRGERWDWTLRYRMIGRRDDRDPASSSRVRLEPYDLLGLSGRWRFSESASATFRVDNIQGRSYEEIAGYGVPGANAYAGLALEF